MKNIIVLIVCVIGITACAQKEYSADAIFKEWQIKGDSAPSLVEITALCNRDRDTGHRNSPVCQVENIATSYIFEAKRKANFLARQQKENQ